MRVVSKCYTPAVCGSLQFLGHCLWAEEMEKFAEFVSSIGQNTRSSSYLSSSTQIQRGNPVPNSPTVSYVSCDVARQHALPLNTQPQAGNDLFLQCKFPCSFLAPKYRWTSGNKRFLGKDHATFLAADSAQSVS